MKRVVVTRVMRRTFQERRAPLKISKVGAWVNRAARELQKDRKINDLRSGNGLLHALLYFPKQRSSKKRPSGWRNAEKTKKTAKTEVSENRKSGEFAINETSWGERDRSASSPPPEKLSILEGAFGKRRQRRAGNRLKLNIEWLNQRIHERSKRRYADDHSTIERGD